MKEISLKPKASTNNYHLTKKFTYFSINSMDGAEDHKSNATKFRITPRHGN